MKYKKKIMWTFLVKVNMALSKKRSMATLSIALQSMITRALDTHEYVLVASLDPCSAFDLVNIDLLLKVLKLIGLPIDVSYLIEI